MTQIAERNLRINVRLDVFEFALIGDAARRAGLRPGQYARLALLAASALGSKPFRDKDGRDE